MKSDVASRRSLGRLGSAAVSAAWSGDCSGLPAFVGEKRRFDEPVIVDLFPGGNARALGFVTQESLDALGIHDHVSVYMPHSYNFSGQMYLFPRSAVRRLDTNSSDMMAFIVSGGVTELPQLIRATAPTP